MLLRRQAHMKSGLGLKAQNGSTTAKYQENFNLTYTNFEIFSTDTWKGWTSAH